MMMDEMSPHPGPMYQQPMDLPFARRSASSRSYNRRNRPHTRPNTDSRRHELFLSHDEDNELEDGELYYDDDADTDSDQGVYPPSKMPHLSRQSSVGSNSGPRPFPRKRANSLSAMPPPPPFLMDSPRRQVPGSYFYPPPMPPPSHQRLNPRFAAGPRRMVHSVPTSPQLSSSKWQIGSQYVFQWWISASCSCQYGSSSSSATTTFCCNATYCASSTAATTSSSNSSPHDRECC
ncbi:hypothetical protein G6F42_026961 [Rhizopus arrhizus]|nr:hypothetical protein G6F42_026961 [Rhizopus arrhizus]